MLKRIIVAVFLVVMPLTSSAAEQLELLEAKPDLGDKASLQRGATVFVNFCLSCHSASFLRYNRMGASWAPSH